MFRHIVSATDDNFTHSAAKVSTGLANTPKTFFNKTSLKGIDEEAENGRPENPFKTLLGKK